ncbi:MAG TPA: YDG domain-containing protein, partial [Caulobacteraceae bacterium]
YDSKNVMGMDGSTLSVNSFTINDGNGGANYDVTVNTARGTITAADLTLNPVTETKTYDGTTDAVAPTPKLFGTDTIAITEVFDSKNAGPRTLSISGYSINDGNGGANYDVTVGDPVAGLINQKALTASLVGTVTKTYDGDTTATLTSGNYQLPGVINGDDVSLNDPTSGTYDNRNAGIGKVVTVTGLQISGADAANYTVNGTAAGAIGIITPAALTLTAVTDTKTYDGGVSSDGVPTNSPLIGGDSITGAVQTFGSKNVLGAGGSTLSVTGYTINDGNDGHNYTVTLVSAPGTINPAPLTIAAVTDTKDFDGTTTSTATPDIIGLVGTDTGVATEAFDSKNAGARILSVVGFTIDDGNDGGNYIVTTTTADGTITASATPIVVNPPPTDVIPTDFQSVASFIGGDGTNTTVVNVFPVGAQDPAQAGLGDSSPITGAGNRDLWTGSDDADKPCPPSSTPCPPAAGTAP